MRLPLPQRGGDGERRIAIIARLRDRIASARKTSMMPAMALLDLTRLHDSPLCRDPFDFVVVEKFLRDDSLPRLIDEFPLVPGHGSYPLSTLAWGGALFAGLARELEGEEMRHAIESKFELNLAGRPTLITLRGYSDGKDGAIHTDSATKLVTVLIYMNPEWEEAAGRLRLLRRGDDLADYAAEVSPLAGTMVAFRRSATSFHGHRPHVGPRRSIQLNWVVDSRVLRRELSRHVWSARVKALNPFRRAGPAIGKRAGDG